MPDSSRWPIDPITRSAIPPRPQPGYYPGFNTLSQKNFWDEATRAVVLRRVNEPPAIRFFAPGEARLLQAICDRIVPQDDRDDPHRIPIVNGIDHRLSENRTDGYRYENMPPDREAYRLGLQAIEAIALHQCGKSFLHLGPLEQDHVLKTIHDGDPPAGQKIWNRMPVARFWMLLVQDVVEQYYAHPWAWDEIGFGGPAYPRAYVRLERGEPEPWEVAEVRYSWEPPEASLSGETAQIGGMQNAKGASGQGGTH
jgi:hypothetical protein